MKEKNRLQIDDTVLWRGDPPRTPRQTALVTGIDRDAAGDFNHTGVAADQLKWKHVKGAIVTFDSGTWDYGANIRRLKQPKAWRAEAYAHRSQEHMLVVAEKAIRVSSSRSPVGVMQAAQDWNGLHRPCPAHTIL